MATIVQAPTFAADPNAVPNVDPFGNVMRGYQLSQLPSKLKAERQQAQANLQKTQLENQQYIPLTNSEIAQRQAQTGLTNQQSSWYGRLTGSEIAKNQAEAAKAGQADNGITVGVDANGNPIVQIGGSSKGGARSGGRLGVDEYGNVTSELTPGNKGAVQKRVIGEQVMQPFIEDLVKNMPQFQTGQRQLQSSVSGLFNQVGAGEWLDKQGAAKSLGLDSTLPSQKATADASLTTTVDGMLNALNFKATDQQTKSIESIMAPKRGESAKGYRDRITRFSQQLAQNSAEAQKFNATGVPTGININGQAAPRQAPAPNPQLSQVTPQQQPSMSIDDQIAAAEAAAKKRGMSY